MIRCRRIKESELELIMQWRMSEEITRCMNSDPVLTIEGQKAWLKQIESDSVNRTWMIEVDGIPAGIMTIFDVDTVHRRCGWGYYIGERSVRSLKLALSLEWNLYRYLFEERLYNSVTADVLAFNTEVIALHKMCGCREVGVLKQHIWKRGRFHDTVLMQICADEWRAKSSSVSFDSISFEEYL